MDEREELFEESLEHYVAGLVTGLLRKYSEDRAEIRVLPPIVLENGLYDCACLIEIGGHTYEVRITKKGQDRIIDER